MALRRSPVIVIVPLEILYSWRMIQLDEIGIAALSPSISLAAMFNDSVSARSSLKCRGHTNVAPYGRSIDRVIGPDEAVDEAYQA
jgi:hypothetical protein